MYGKKNENLIFGFVQTCYALKTVIFFGKKVSNHFILGNFLDSRDSLAAAERPTTS